MPLFSQNTPFDQDVEKATSEMNTTEDWSLILDICEKVSRTQNGSRDCLKSIVKRLNHRVPFVSMQALTLLDACINNCGRPFHLEICSRDFVSECRTLINQKAHPKVAQRLRFMIKKWADMSEFKDDPALNLVPSFFDSLKKEGTDFSDPDAGPKKVETTAREGQQEEDDIAKAIALSLQEADKSAKTTSLYPTSFNTSAGGASAIYASPRPREPRKVRALYDFEAAEDNELTFKGGELISVLDDSDPNWWKGFNHRGEGLFPANFVTADLSVEPEESKPEKKTVQFNEQVEVKTVEPLPDEVEIDENKIDETLQLIQNADPTGETQPDSQELLNLEEQCKVMGPLIDTELEKIDKKHAQLVDLNKKVMDALQMYHSLMRENPAFNYTMKAPQGFTPGMMPPPPAPAAAQMTQPMYNGQPQYAPQGQMPAGPGQVPPAQGQMPQGQGQMPPGSVMPPPQSFSPPLSSQQQQYSSLPNQMPQTTYTSLPTANNMPMASGPTNLPQQPVQNGGAVPTQLAGQTGSYQSMPPQTVYQPPLQQQPLL
ncbi:signal transducing adapter molecule 2-like [Haliotis cracherodii]|uniref:signal transducing adapter molecule 2-like n=1 Tax=Haliotis cracherodii TaxID=6455 RepID=UPI0039EA9FC8